MYIVFCVLSNQGLSLNIFDYILDPRHTMPRELLVKAGHEPSILLAAIQVYLVHLSESLIWQIAQLSDVFSLRDEETVMEALN